MFATQRAYWILLATALVAILCGVIFVGRHVVRPADGARLEPGKPAITSAGLLLTPIQPQPGGLQTGDLLIAVEGREMESWAQNLFGQGEPAPDRSLDDALTYTVRRDHEKLDLRITLSPYPFWQVVRTNWGTIAFALIYLIVATYVFVRRPDHVAGRILFLAAAGLTSSTAWSFGLQVSDFTDGVGFWLFKICTLLFYDLFWIATCHFALVFPRPLPFLKRRAWIEPAIYTLPYLFLSLYLGITGAISNGILDWFSRWTLAEGAHAAVFLSLTLIALVWQYRRNTTGASRRQIRWVVLAGLLCGGGGLLLYILPGVLGLQGVGPNTAGLMVLAFPIAISIAILRDNLFDIDTLINRTLVYGTLTLSTILLYTLIVGYLGNLLQVRQTTLLAFLATGVIAVIFQPLRERLQRLVNRWMYGERDDPYAVLARMSQRIEGVVAPERVLPTIVETIAQALKLPYVAIWWREQEKLVEAISYGLKPSGGEEKRYQLVFQGESIGELVLASRSSDEPFTTAEDRLLGDLARQAGAAVHNVRLTSDLIQARQRLVTAREEERRRIRRDLHDGLGPQLASLTLQIDAARNVLASNPQQADAKLERLKEQTKNALAEIRRIAYDLRPPALDELGLLSALREAITAYEASGVRIAFHSPQELPPLPAAVEVAVYRIVTEALTNVVRHARATNCVVRLGLKNGLEMEILDDGGGFRSEARAGVGLNSMRERAIELGGQCTIESQPAGGTRVYARLPLTDAPS